MVFATVITQIMLAKVSNSVGSVELVAISEGKSAIENKKFKTFEQ